MAVKSGGRRCLSNNRWERSIDWERIKMGLFERRICDLGLRIKGSPIEPFIGQLEQELTAKGMDYKPSFYLTDS